MKKVHFLFLILFIAFGQTAIAQTYIGISAGPKWEQFSFSDPGGRLVDQNTVTSLRAGIDVQIQDGEKFRWAFGLYHYAFSSFPVDLSEPNRTIEGNDLMPGNYTAGAVILPFSIKYDFLTFKRSSFHIQPGISFGLLTGDKGPRVSETGSLFGDNDDEIFSYTITEAYENRLLVMPFIGLGYERPFLSRGKVQLNGQYFIGTSDAIRSEIAYQIPAENFSNTATATSDGTAFSLSLSLLYPISK
ncbi:MAG: hypothetical protein WBB45_11085 [Cyclobacteriaceae bacterium]